MAGPRVPVNLVANTLARAEDVDSNFASVSQTSPVCLSIISTMLAYNTTGLVEGQIFLIDSYNTYTNGNVDGGGGRFMMTSQTPTVGTAGSRTGAVDNFIIFQSSYDTTKYFIRQFTGPYYCEWSGAKGDLSADAGALLNTAASSVPDGGVLTAFTEPNYLITTPLNFLNRTALTFSSGTTIAGQRTTGGQLYFNGSAGGTCIVQHSCGMCLIQGWIITLNAGAIGIDTDTAASGGTRISTQNTFRGVTVYNNSNTANAVAYSISATSATNNEFMTYDDCAAFGSGALSGENLTAWFQGNNGGFNTHYHVLRNFEVFGAKVGLSYETGGIRTEGFCDLSACQIAYGGSATYPCLFEFSDHEQCWQIVGPGNGGGGVVLRGARIAGCGASGLALFDFTSHTSINCIDTCNIDVGAPRTAGGYLFNMTGVTADLPLRMVGNIYTGPPVLTDLHGWDPTTPSFTTQRIDCYSDELLANVGTSLFLTTNPPTPYALSNFGLISSGSNSAESSSGTLSLGAYGFICGVSTDGTAISTISLATAPLFTANPALLCYASGNVTFTNSGNVNSTATVNSGHSFWLYLYPGTNKWQVCPIN